MSIPTILLTVAMKTVAPFEIGIVAANLDALLPFYTHVLGFRILSDISTPATISRPAGLAPEGYRVVRLESAGGDRIKLAQPLSASTPATTSTHAMTRQGIAYVTFIVEDLASLRSRLQAAGAAIHSEGIVVLRPGVSMLLARDPEQNWLEFVHYDDVASYRPPQPRAD